MYRSWWATALAVSLGAMYGWIGLAAHGPTRVLGLTGALLILAALALARRSLPAAAVLLVLGAAPLAVAAWWSIAAPLLGLLTLPLGWLALRARRGRVRPDRYRRSGADRVTGSGRRRGSGRSR